MRFLSNNNKDLSLVEQKRLQWAKERDEMERIGELFSATTTRKIEKTSIRTYYSNVDLSHKFNSQKPPYYDGNGSLVVDDIIYDDNKNNGKRYYQNKQDNLYIPYGNERIRSPSLPPIGRQKYGTKQQTLSTSADEDTSGYLSDNNNNNIQEPSMLSPDIWIKNQPSSIVYNESDQERNSRSRMRLPNESLNDHHHHPHHHDHQQQQRRNNHHHHHHHQHLQTQQYYNQLSSTASSSTTSSNIKFQQQQQQQKQHQQQQEHQQQLNENYNILMNNKREKGFYEIIDHKSRKNQRNETTSRLTYLTSNTADRKNLNNLLDDTDQDEFQLSKSHGTPSSSSSSDTSRDFSLASSYQESSSVLSKSKEERAKWGDRGVMVGHFFDPLLLKDQSNQNKTGPVWLERGLHDVRDSGDESTGSYSYIRGQNAPIDPNDLAERATRRLKALEFQNAIKQQLEERELERKRDLEHRKLEELKYEERLQRQAEIERERLEYEKRKQQDKLDQEKRKQESMRLALEKASIDAKLEKEKRLREKGLMPQQSSSINGAHNDTVDENDDVDEKIFVEKTGSNRIDIRMDGCDGGSIIDLTQFPQQKSIIIRDNNNRDDAQSQNQNDLIKTTVRENQSKTNNNNNNNDERFLIGTPIKLKQKNIDDVMKIPNEKVTKTKRAAVNRIEEQDKLKHQQLIDDTGINYNNYDNHNNDNNHNSDNNDENDIKNNGNNLADIDGIALVLQAIPPALVPPTLQQYSNDLINLNSNLNSIQFAIMLAQQMQYNQQAMNLAFNNLGGFDTTQNPSSLRSPATAPPQLEKVPDVQQMKLQLNNNNNLPFIDIPKKNNNEIISSSVYDNDEIISVNNREEMKQLCNVCGKQQQKMDLAKLKENVCEKVTISTSTTIDGIIQEESSQSNDDKLYSLPHDATFTKESTNNLMIKTNNNNDHCIINNNNNNNKAIIKLNASTQTEFDYKENKENTEHFDEASLPDDKSVMNQDDQQQQEYHYHHYHHHHVYLNEMANNNQLLSNNSSLKELTTTGHGNQSAHDNAITDVNRTYDNNKLVTHRTLATNTSSLPRNLSKLTTPMGKKSEERPKWGVNRPSTQYVKASERDPFYMKKQQRKKLSKYYSLGDSGIDSGDIDIVSGTDEPSQIMISDQMQSRSKSHVSSLSLASSSGTSSAWPTVPNSSININNSNNNDNQTFRNDTTNTIIQTQQNTLNNNNNKLARNICTEILPIKTDLNGRVYLNFREASIIIDEDEIKNTIKRRLYKKMDRIMNRRKTADEIFQNVNDDQKRFLTSKCSSIINSQGNENGNGVILVDRTDDADADDDDDEDEEKQNMTTIACKKVIKKRNNTLKKTKVIHSDIDLELC